MLLTEDSVTFAFIDRIHKWEFSGMGSGSVPTADEGNLTETGTSTMHQENSHVLSEKHTEQHESNSTAMTAQMEETALLGEQNSPSIVSIDDERKDEERNSNLAESYLECRICRSRDDEPLISPCKCSGSSKWIHQSCLVQWFQISRATKCELCSEKIIIKKFLKPVREVS